MKERRQTPRVKCRLQCAFRAGREVVRARVLDVSEGGLCILSPVPLKRGETVTMQIDVPPGGPVDVEATAWHVRQIKSSATNRKSFCIGMMLECADEGLLRLLPAAPGGAEAVEEAGEAGEADAAGDCDPNDVTADLISFRVRVRARVGPRTRLVTISASSEDEARELAVTELDEDWVVMEVRAA